MTAADLWAFAERPPPPVIPGQLAVPDGPAIGSLCTGYGGLDMAVRQVLGGHLAWVADPDPGAAAILTHHHPDVPNLGDITATDWATVPPVDIVCGGYPCQPFSTAGKRKGTADARHIWPYIATALRVLRPRLCLFENVAGHLRLGFDTVLRDLAALGFDAEWITLRASDVGAAHQRERLFVVAANLGHRWSRPARHGWHGPADGNLSAADADRSGRRAELDDVLSRQPHASWGRFGPAIHRWARVLGRPCPPAVDAVGRLNPELTEWLMGLPAGHVTAVPGLSRTRQLKALGNGVVPLQGAAALRLLLARTPVTT